MDNKKEKKLVVLFIIILLIPFFCPNYISSGHLPIILNFYKLAKIVSLVIVTFIIITKAKFNKLNILMILYYGILIIFTNIKGIEIIDTFNVSLQVLFPSLIIGIFIEKYPKQLVNAFLLLFEILVYINFITIILFPNGLYEGVINKTNFFLGYDNNHIMYILPGLFFTVLYKYINNNKYNLRNYLYILVAILSIMIRFSATSVVGIVLFIVFLVFNNLFLSSKWINFKNLIAINSFAFISIIILRLQNIFNFFIIDVLNKDLTFTGRTYIWNEAIHYIKLSPIIGYGNEGIIERTMKSSSVFIINTHNIILEIFYTGGIALFLIFFFIIFLQAKQLIIYKDNNISKLISLTIFIFLIISLFEAYSLTFLFILCTFGYSISKMIKKGG